MRKKAYYVNKQNLIYCGQEIDEGHLLNEYDIQDSSVICVVRLRAINPNDLLMLDLQLLQKLFNHPVLVWHKDFIQINPLERRTIMKLMYNRELCLLYPVVALDQEKQNVSRLKVNFFEKWWNFRKKSKVDTFDAWLQLQNHICSFVEQLTARRMVYSQPDFH